MQYIHYGHDKFEKGKFQEIKNIPHNNKPYGGLWASRKNTNAGWKSWVLGNDLDIGNFSTSFEFSLKKDAKVLIIDSLEVLRDLPSSESDVTMMQLGLLDFEKLSKDYDAIEVLISKDRRLYFHLYGWDCDSIIIMNPDIIVEEKGKEKMESLSKEELINILKYSYYMSRLIRPISAKQSGLELAGYGEICDFYREIVCKLEKDESIDLKNDEFLKDIYDSIKNDVSEKDIEYDGFFVGIPRNTNDEIEKD